MRHLLRPSHQDRSGHVALIGFVLAYAATLALVIAPEQVILALNSWLVWPLR